jgi:hypothetical protein
MHFPFEIEDLFNFLYLLYRSVRDAVRFILENTLVRANPTIAAKYADIMTLLISLTAILLILELVASAKKVLAVMLVLGWVLLIVSMVMTLI